MKLYGSGGTSSKVIIDIYENAVKKLKLAIERMRPTLPDPTEWQMLENNFHGKENFEVKFSGALDQVNTVKQYYEFEWNDDAFGITEHEWLQYVGAYKNLQVDGPEPPILEVRPLAGKTKLSGSQVIDAAHILNLIVERVETKNGVQTVDEETLRIISEQIQELSNLGRMLRRNY